MFLNKYSNCSLPPTSNPWLITAVQCGAILLVIKLKELSKRACRIIRNVDIFTLSEYMFNQLKILPVSQRIAYHKTLLLYKAMHNLAPDYISDLFVPISNVSPYMSRSSVNGNIIVPTIRTQLARQSFSYTSIQIWNNLHVKIWNIESINSFKKAIKSSYVKPVSSS